MVESYLRKYDWFVLKPMWLILLGLSLFFFLRAEWAMGAAMLVLAFFGVGATGAGLHSERSAAQLAEGYPHRTGISEKTPVSMDHETSRRLAKATLRLAFIVGLAAGIVSFHFGLRWYFAVLIAAMVAWLGPITLILPFAVIMRNKQTPSI